MARVWLGVDYAEEAEVEALTVLNTAVLIDQTSLKQAYVMIIISVIRVKVTGTDNDISTRLNVKHKKKSL